MPPHAKLGEYRFPPPATESVEARIARNKRMLARVLNTPVTVGFVGAGISRHLGYPGWDEFVVELLDTTVEALRREGHELSGDIARLRARAGSPTGEEALFLLGRCRTALKLAGCIDTDYREFFLRFSPSAGRPAAPDLVGRLLELGIQRFATTNYDVEVERALCGGELPPIQELDPDALGDRFYDGETVCSFHQLPAHRRAQAAFPLGRVSWTKRMVFHLHGRYDEVDSIVATEDDYQRFYLDQQNERVFFHQSIDLLLRSNPILFAGYRLEDPDLLRYLRTLSALEPRQKSSRPLFALFHYQDESEVEPLLHRCYDRFGIHAIPYPSQGDTPLEWAQGLDGVLKELTEQKSSWREGWLQKPTIREVVVQARPPAIYFHHRLKHRIRTLGADRIRRELGKLKADTKGDGKLVIVLGRGGTGKSFTVQKFLEEQNAHDFEGLFFWSSYYTDDAITGMDRALTYMDPEGRYEGSRFTRFQRLMRERRFLLVFDGFERLLAEQEDGGPELGHPTTYGIRHFLEVVASPENRSVVILTSRLWPSPFGGVNEHPAHIRMHRLEDLSPADIYPAEPFSSYPKAEVAELCALLRGHAYGLVLAGRYLELHRREPGKLTELATRLSRRDEMRRNAELISILLDELERRLGQTVLALLERIVLFVSPVSYEVLETLYRSGDPPADSPPCADALEILLANHLVFSIEQFGPGGPRLVYTTHPTVRTFVVQRIHGASTGAMPNFTLPGFTSGTAVLDPGPKKARKTLQRVLRRLDSVAREAHEQGAQLLATDHCRAVFGALRSSTETLSAPRWGTYHDQMQMVFDAANLVRDLAGRHWRFHTDLRDITDPDAPLYADELAWLYNDMGLSCAAEGNMADTFALWDQGYQINLAIEPEVGQYMVQSLLHLGHTYIEVGRLNIAREYLHECELKNARIGSEDYSARIKGYLGVLAHLQGDRDRALRYYDTALQILHSGTPNPRAEAWFRFHRANLHTARHDFDAARHDLETANGIARTHRFLDLAGHARGGFGRLERELHKYEEAQVSYGETLQIARHIGMRRLECEALLELGRIAIDRKDFETGLRLGKECLALANELALGLRQTHGLILIGMASAGMGFREVGLAYLDHARELADFQEYGSRAGEIRSLRARLTSRPN